MAKGPSSRSESSKPKLLSRSSSYKPSSSSSLSSSPKEEVFVQILDSKGKEVASKSLFSSLRNAQASYKARKQRALAEKEREQREIDARELARVEKEERRTARRLKRERRDRERSERLARGESLAQIEADEKERKRKKEEKKAARKRRLQSGNLYSASEFAESCISIDTDTTTTSEQEEMERHQYIAGPNALRGPPGPGTQMIRPGVAPLPPINFTLDEDTPLSRLLENVMFWLDEVQAVHNNITLIVETLKGNPDNLIAFGMSLGEIAAYLAKASPILAAAVKVHYPLIASLLASPGFAFGAAAAGAGACVVLGGYKLVQALGRRQANNGVVNIQNKGVLRPDSIEEPESEEARLEKLRELNWAQEKERRDEALRAIAASTPRKAIEEGKSSSRSGSSGSGKGSELVLRESSKRRGSRDERDEKEKKKDKEREREKEKERAREKEKERERMSRKHSSSGKSSSSGADRDRERHGHHSSSGSKERKPRERSLDSQRVHHEKKEKEEEGPRPGNLQRSRTDGVVSSIKTFFTEKQLGYEGYESN